jgi:hypothetical protein
VFKDIMTVTTNSDVITANTDVETPPRNDDDVADVQFPTTTTTIRNEMEPENEIDLVAMNTSTIPPQVGNSSKTTTTTTRNESNNDDNPENGDTNDEDKQDTNSQPQQIQMTVAADAPWKDRLWEGTTKTKINPSRF